MSKRTVSILAILVAGAAGGVLVATFAAAKKSAVQDHRAAPASCEKKRAPGNPGAQTQGCRSDAECTKGKNGRCQKRGSRMLMNECTYDECFVDADCPPKGICSCDHDDTNQGSGHYCSTGNCRVDADCGKNGFCSPSYPLCTLNGPSYPTGFYCHTTKDECNNDQDCTPPTKKGYGPVGTRCVWSPEAARWSCSSEECPVG